MVRDPLAKDDSPDLQAVLDALDDPDCREILHQLESPMTAGELAECTDVPQSTLYRKLNLLTEASLLVEGTEIRSDGHHTTRYQTDFERVLIELNDERELDVTITRPPRAPEERLARLWEEVRKET